jgi:hypothetical protein
MKHSYVLLFTICTRAVETKLNLKVSLLCSTLEQALDKLSLPYCIILVYSFYLPLAQHVHCFNSLDCSFSSIK